MSAGASTRVPSSPPLTTRRRCVLPNSRIAFAAATASPLTNAIAVGPSRIGDQLGEAGLLGRAAGQRVLEDLVLGAGGTQRASQVGQLG